MDSSNPYAASEIPLEEAYGWTERGTLIVEPTDEVIELPRICYSSGETENLVEEDLTCRYARLKWLNVTAAVVSVICGPLAKSIGLDRLAPMGLLAVWVFVASCFIKTGKVQVRAYTTRFCQQARTYRRRLHAVLIIIIFAITGFCITQFSSPIVLVVLTATMSAMFAFLRTQPKATALLAEKWLNYGVEIQGFAPEFHVSRQTSEGRSLDSASST